MNWPTIYLAGAIRDHHPEDIEWRETVVEVLRSRAIFINPLGGKTFSRSTATWVVSGIYPSAKTVFKHDSWCVDRADIVLANMTSLADGYPSIGSLMEIGRATKVGSLIYLILEPGYSGYSSRDNNSMYTLHPFLEQAAAEIFDSVADAIAFLQRHLDVLSGANPHFDGVVE